MSIDVCKALCTLALAALPTAHQVHHHPLTCVTLLRDSNLRLSNCQKLLPSLQRLLLSTSGFHLTLKRRDPAALNTLHRAHRLHW